MRGAHPGSRKDRTLGTALRRFLIREGVDTKAYWAECVKRQERFEAYLLTERQSECRSLKT